jgi:hypothetical protein
MKLFVCQVGGRNTVLVDALTRRIPLVSDIPTIIFGADVTHPHPGEDSIPSIAAVHKLIPICTQAFLQIDFILLLLRYLCTEYYVYCLIVLAFTDSLMFYFLVVLGWTAGSSITGLA